MAKKEHHNRPDLIGEHSFGDAGQLISFVLFITIWIVDGFFIHKTTFLNEQIPFYIRLPFAAIPLGISLYLVRKSISIVFGEVREKPEVIRKEIYGKIRHPMYVSEILLYFGLLCLNISLAAVGVYIIVVIFLYAICRYEEKILLKYFGDEYRQYMKEVPMWIPKFKKRQLPNSNNQG